MDDLITKKDTEVSEEQMPEFTAEEPVKLVNPFNNTKNEDLLTNKKTSRSSLKFNQLEYNMTLIEKYQAKFRKIS